MTTGRVVTVEIGGQRYPIRSGLEEQYVTELAAYVDQKMRAASQHAPSSDMLSLAVLVALNIADEYFRVRDNESSTSGEINARAMRIERLLDDVIARASDGAPPQP